MEAYLLPNGNLLVPKRAEGDGVLGDGFVEVGTDDDEYKAWMRYYKEQGREPPKREEPPA